MDETAAQVLRSTRTHGAHVTPQRVTTVDSSCTDEPVESSLNKLWNRSVWPVAMRLDQVAPSRPADHSCVSSPSPTDSRDRRVKPERNDTIELLRVVAACGVIWFHMETTPFKSVGYSGLVFFLIVSVVFQMGAAERGLWHGFFRRRASRLLVPWAAWFVIYGLLNLVKGKVLFPYSSGIVPDILAGPWIGLWYLPFSFISACLV